MDLPSSWRAVPRTDLGLVRARGADAVAFLQGQLSNDVALLAPGRLQLAGYHNPQGRVIALLRLAALAPDDILAILPAALAPVVTAKLKRFVLRSKVQITDESAAWSIQGLMPALAPGFPGNVPGATSAAGSGSADTCLSLPPLPGGAQVLPVDDSRWLILAPAAEACALKAALAGCGPATLNDWQLADIAAGLPQVYPATTEAFVAQMLNLDLVNGISFEKGCYTGQEIIARAHYRGRVRRRMQRFVSDAPTSLQPGDAGQLADGRTFKVVEAAQRADGCCEFLAVAPLSAVPAQTGADSGADAGAAAGLDTAQPPIPAHVLSLPYDLPAD